MAVGRLFGGGLETDAGFRVGLAGFDQAGRRLWRIRGLDTVAEIIERFEHDLAPEKPLPGPADQAQDFGAHGRGGINPVAEFISWERDAGQLAVVGEGRPGSAAAIGGDLVGWMQAGFEDQLAFEFVQPFGVFLDLAVERDGRGDQCLQDSGLQRRDAIFSFAGHEVLLPFGVVRVFRGLFVDWSLPLGQHGISAAQVAEGVGHQETHQRILAFVKRAAAVLQALDGRCQVGLILGPGLPR